VSHTRYTDALCHRAGDTAGGYGGSSPRRRAVSHTRYTDALCHRAGDTAVPGGQARREPRRGFTYDENAKIVLDVKVWPGATVVDGKDGSFGESGKCWVSKV
jgi:hypothetical protein